MRPLRYTRPRRFGCSSRSQTAVSPLSALRSAATEDGRSAVAVQIRRGNRSSHFWQLPRVAALAVEHRAGRLVTRELLFHRVPLEFAPKFDGDIRQVTDRGNAMPNIHREVRVFAAL